MSIVDLLFPDETQINKTDSSDHIEIKLGAKVHVY